MPMEYMNEEARRRAAGDKSAPRSSHCTVGGLVYLATPYSHEQPEVREQRFLVVNRVAADLMRDGMHIYSPISHTHPIAIAGDLPKGWDFWEQYARVVLASCVMVIVLRQDGWEQSIGVAAELVIAKEMGLPVEFIDP